MQQQRADAPIIDGQGFELSSHGSGEHAPHSENAKLKRAWRRRQADCLFIFERSNGVDTSSGKCFCVVLSTGRASKHAHPHPSCVVFVTDDDKMGSSIMEKIKKGKKRRRGILTLSNQTVKVIDMRVLCIVC